MMTTLDMDGYGISLLNRINQQYDLEDFNGLYDLVYWRLL